MFWFGMYAISLTPIQQPQTLNLYTTECINFLNTNLPAFIATSNTFPTKKFALYETRQRLCITRHISVHFCSRAAEQRPKKL